MIFDFETLFLGQKFEIRDNQMHRWISELLACRSVLSNFCRGAELSKINSIVKQVAKSSKVMILGPLENIPESPRKIVWPNEFF
jgi:hypothetical protein